MDWGKLIDKGVGLAKNAITTKIVNSATTVSPSVTGKLLDKLVASSDNKIDDSLVDLIKGTVHAENIDSLLVGYIESLAKKTNNNVDDTLVKLVADYLKNKAV